MTTSTAVTPTADTAVDRLLEAITGGRGATVAGLYADDAILDATVPGWRFRKRGGEAIAAQYAEWFADPGQIEELDRQPVSGGEVVTYLLTWSEGGIPHAAHHCHRLALDGAGLITADQVFCGGRWNATLLAAMAEAGHAG